MNYPFKMWVMRSLSGRQHSQQQNKQVNRILFLTEEGLKQLAAQDGRHFAHAVLQGLLIWTGQVGLVLSEEPYCSLCVCWPNTFISCQTWKHAQIIHCIRNELCLSNQKDKKSNNSWTKSICGMSANIWSGYLNSNWKKIDSATIMQNGKGRY